MIKKLPFCGALLLLGIYAVAQNEVQSSAIQQMEHTAKAPNTASLSKYFEVPVNMSSGIPNISIPLYTIKTGNISLPISLSYHAGGIQVNEPASWVGLGWSLNCGGVVSKKANGLDDFYAAKWTPLGNGFPPAFYNYFSPRYDIDYDWGFTNVTDIVDTSYTYWGSTHGVDVAKIMGRITQNKYDGEADQYYFTTPEKSGMIFYDQKRQKFQTDKIDGWSANISTNEYDYGNAWAIKNINGISYSFGQPELTLSPFYNPGSSHPTDDYYISAWYMNQISDIINNRSVSLNYDVSPIYYVSNGQSEWIDYKLYGNSVLYHGGSGTETIYRQGNDVTVKEITYNEGTIQFVKDTATRTDIPTAPKALREIRVYDIHNQLKKKFLFEYFYHSSRLFLKSIQELNYIDSSTTGSTPYIFNYDTAVALPARFSYAQDYYGYYNGKTANNTVIPTQPEPQALGLPSFANRNVDTNYAKACMLRQIKYPTGGTLNFEFENNRNQDDSVVGGLRVKRIVNVDSVAMNKITRQYNYGTGQELYKPKFYYLYQYMTGNNQFLIVRVSGASTLPLSSNQGSPVFYGGVEELQIGDSVNLKTNHYFGATLDDLPAQFFEAGVPYDKYPNFENYRAFESLTEYFSYKNGTYQRIKVDSSTFKSLNQFQTYIWNVQAAWAMMGEWIVWAGNDPYMQTTMNCFPQLNLYKFFKESLVNTSVNSKMYDNSGNVIETSIHKIFDQTNGQLKQTWSIQSNGDTLKSYYTYVGDLPYTNSSKAENTEINYLLEWEITGLPIEIVTTRRAAGGSEWVTGASLITYEQGKIKKQYSLSGNKLYSSMERVAVDDSGFYYDQDYEMVSEVIYDSDNKPVQVNQRSGHQAYLWEGDLLICTVTNGHADSIAYSSFESESKGNWAYVGYTTADVTSPTGSKCYSLSGGSVSKAGLNSNRNYLVSYWSKNGSYSVSGTSAVKTGKTVEGWTFYEHSVSGVSTVTVSGSGYIDELRLYPRGSFMKTQTYIPLVGIDSECDINNRITYYEYDSFGRLRRIKDQDKNIIKVIDYKYQTSPY